jgi:XrtJ-associated TM-motif-TM protein
MKKPLLLMFAALSLIAVVPAHAQGGCDDTPENPTLVLAGLSSGVFAISSLRNHLRARRKSNSRGKSDQI